MQLENKFTIAAPIEEAWAALNNPETVAPCFPGATLTEYEDDSFTGTVKVKLGPISLTYKGKGTYVERDDANHKVVIDATGRDSRGNGTAAAKVTGSMVAQGPDKTEVTMVTDLSITGRPAQFGRGVISDVSEKIIGQFASCLTDKLSGSAAADAAHAAPSADAPAAAAPTSAPTAATAGTEAPKPVTTPKSTPTGGPLRSEVDAIDLLDSAGAPVLKRLAPVVGVLGVLVAIFVIVRRLRSK
ncbi:MAG: SRPBCC family protein [Pseudonocardia sp.]|uniref:SRPBCC family protein n=1 Tax=unclassified Pseudonocardia TaxID=2619320 RepID=UPI00086857D8|nr:MULTISPECIES: SRPBCC family protein [unclassified Pseudonocardia]MBN9109024.1 SRPBCC family protein [Pseudonocardia sp.]ODU23359.1 MAG: carbon monoxide dehydrogenase [Pseudonocardia sp. SCN 72-51]ODV02585.1 MAG: carbon monoxide dehydrogenase [Pseudonocardia sp. SCN 73-27]